MFSPSESLNFSQSMDRGVYFFPEIDSIRELNEKFSRPIAVNNTIVLTVEFESFIITAKIEKSKVSYEYNK